MSMQINKSAYEKLIKEDIEWLLSNTKDSLERRHIVEVLNYSPERLYASGSSETPKDLEEAAEKHSTDYDSTIWCVLESSNQKTIWKREHKETFIAGAKWQREQMMKEAVEGFIYGGPCREEWWMETPLNVIPAGLHVKPGDNVKVIIIEGGHGFE